MRIIVGNKIEVENPTPEIISWCRENLVLSNPEYYKRQRMGKWTGNTPQSFALYEKNGGKLYLPFGCVGDVKKMYGSEYRLQSAIKPFKAFDYDSAINPYPYQENAVKMALKAKNGVIVMPCGAGKTQTALEIVSRIGAKCLWLTHTQDLLNQSLDRAKSVLGAVKSSYGKITAGKVDIGEGITFATVQTMAKLDLSQYRDEWGVIIIDECMPGETLIDTPTGKKELKNLRIDDIITSYNRNVRRLENKRITHIFKSKVHDVVKVKLSNGEEIICTKNHPIYTRSGRWIEAERLVQNDYVLRLVWEESRNGYDAKNIKAQGIGARLLLLLKRMFRKRWSQKGYLDRRAQTQNIRNDERYKQSVSRSVCGTHEKRQSDEEARSAKSGIGQTERNRTSSKNQMWQRPGINCSSTNDDACTCEKNGSVCRISNTNKNGKRFRLSDLLQSRYSNSRKNGGNRDRWQFSLCDRKTATGSEKRAILKWVRVESVTVQEQTSDRTFGGLCADGYVYNIEVEDNNNYFANGILVHNCQHCAGSPTRVTQFYRVLSNLSARYKFGVTATPHRADGLERSIFALVGDIICEVSKEEVKSTTCPVEVQFVDSGYEPDFDAVLAGDGTINYSALVTDMTENAGRFERVLEIIENARERGGMIVLANRVDYLQRLDKRFSGKSVCLSGNAGTKKAREVRKDALRMLNCGELDCIFATYQLAKEGLDVPNLRTIIFATPEKDSTTVTQAAGRVARKCDGKDAGLVIDIVDRFGMYKGWQKKRISYYKKLDFLLTL